MTWLFLPPTELRAGSIETAGEPAHYLGRVLRARPGDALTVFDGQGHTARAVLTRLHRNRVELEVDEPVAHVRGPGWLRAEIALVKGERLDWAVQKLTEIGVDHIELLSAARSVVRVEADRSATKLERLSTIARSAAAQSRRSFVPSLAGPTSIESLRPDGDRALVFCATRDAPALGPGSWPSPTRVRFAIGPEGGFTDTEVSSLRAHGYQACGLGAATLRAETAALVAATLLADRLGRLG